MNEDQIKIVDAIIQYLYKNNGTSNDVSILNHINSKNLKDSNLTLIIITSLIDEFGIISRNVSDKSLKQLTSKGLCVYNIGFEKFLKKKKREDFFNSYIYKFISFVIPLAISLIALFKEFVISFFKNLFS